MPGFIEFMNWAMGFHHSKSELPRKLSQTHMSGWRHRRAQDFADDNLRCKWGRDTAVKELSDTEVFPQIMPQLLGRSSGDHAAGGSRKVLKAGWFCRITGMYLRYLNMRPNWKVYGKTWYSGALLHVFPGYFFKSYSVLFFLFAIRGCVHLNESQFVEIFENGCSPLEYISTNSHASLGAQRSFIIIHQSLSIIYLPA